MKEFKDKLQDLMNENKISSAEILSKEINKYGESISPNAIRGYLKGIRPKSMYFYECLANFFNVDTDFLYNDSNENRKVENKTIGEEIGLSDQSIKTLKYMKENNLSNIFNNVIESDFFNTLIIKYEIMTLLNVISKKFANLISQYKMNINHSNELSKEKITIKELEIIHNLNNDLKEALSDYSILEKFCFEANISINEHHSILSICNDIEDLEKKFSLDQPKFFYQDIYLKDTHLKKIRYNQFEMALNKIIGGLTNCIDIYTNSYRLLKFELSNDLIKFIDNINKSD